MRRLSIANTTTGGQPVTFTRATAEGSWQAVEPPPGVGAVRQSEVESLLQRLRYLAVQEYQKPLQRAGDLAPLGLEPPAIAVELQLQKEDGEANLRFAVGNKLEDKNEYYLTSSESPFLMTWPAGVVTPFELDVKAQLFDPPAPAAEPSNDGAADAPPK